MIEFKYLLLIVTICFSSVFFGQKNNYHEDKKAIWKGKLNYHFVPSLKKQLEDKTFIRASITKRNKYSKDKKKKGNKVVPGKGLPKRLDPLLRTKKHTTLQQVKSTSLTFETTTETSTPSDPTGAIGRDYYIAAWNTAFRIFHKDGTPATDAASLSTLFRGEEDGDPIVLYDAQADRYIVTEFEDEPNGFHIAISQSNDPVNGGWHIYSADSFQTGTFPDYTKFSIWSDGYYVTASINEIQGENTRTGQVWALERDKMLNGDPDAGIQGFNLTGIVTDDFYSPQAFNVIDDNLPAKGNATLVYMQDDAWEGVNYDHLKLWNINVDWKDPENSTISAPTEILVTPFTGVFDGGSFYNLSQPDGPDIDAIQASIMNQAQFRKFENHNSAVFNFVVNTDTSNELAGIRWYELRQEGDGKPWSIYQEGTYTSLEGRHAFAASMGIDGKGNIAIGYTTVSTEESIALRYTGRFHDDPLNSMTALEELIVQSNSNNPSHRYADYSHLTVDPSNDSDFWFVSEYFNNGIRSNMVGVFQLSEPLPNDIGVTGILAPKNGNLTSTEPVTITIRNFGKNSQTNFPISYTIDGNTKVSETFKNILEAGATAEYTFKRTADLSSPNKSYTISAYTELLSDENQNNNNKIISVTTSIQYCTPKSIEGCEFDGIKRFVLGTIDADDGENGCNSTGEIQGYVDRKFLTTHLDIAKRHSLQVQHNWEEKPDGESLSAWIDFNDNGNFELSEQIVKGEIFKTAKSLESFPVKIPNSAELGSHVLRLKAIDNTSDGDINDPCGDYDYGEVHDYIVKIIGDKSNVYTHSAPLKNADLKVFTLPNKQFIFQLTTDYAGLLTFTVHDLLGKIIVFNNISKNGNSYEYSLDMSYASPGSYFIKIGSKTNYRKYKILVQ